MSFGKISLRLNLKKVYLKDRILSISNLMLFVAQKNMLSAHEIVQFHILISLNKKASLVKYHDENILKARKGLQSRSVAV
jgi:hypothetical protein